ncbi:hypothetical protein STAS_35055 [Striga asiatica]|uniref:Uncharacterized protein n=1 Tax=Striga asiatica TaxID=4170 RepID=A0A5A7RJA2_STRAF|nr:hypothetical protein STAS_35055 [Striga asiatica]
MTKLPDSGSNLNDYNNPKSIELLFIKFEAGKTYMITENDFGTKSRDLFACRPTFTGSPKFWYTLISPSTLAATITIPHAVACTACPPCAPPPPPPPPNDLDDSDSPYPIELDDSDPNDSLTPIPGSIRADRPASSSSLLFLGSGGRSRRLLPFPPPSSSFCGGALLEWWRLDLISTVGGSPGDGGRDILAGEVLVGHDRDLGRPPLAGGRSLGLLHFPYVDLRVFAGTDNVLPVRSERGRHLAARISKS